MRIKGGASPDGMAFRDDPKGKGRMTGMFRKIGIGIIGASPERGWAIDAHLPAISTSPDLELRAVSTSRPESARLAAEAFGVPGYSDHRELVARRDVDLVAVLVKVPHHKELVASAIAAGKSVFCEWPLGKGLEEAVALADMAKRAGVRGFVGLQSRSSPEMQYLRELVQGGYVGRVLSTSIVASGGNWGPVIEPENAYILDRSNGASMMMIPFGHTMDGVLHCLGEFASLSAEVATMRSHAALLGTGEPIPMLVSDQILVAGKLASGAPISVHYRGGMSAGTNFLWEINGDAGDIVVSAAIGLAQLTELTIRGAKQGEALVDLPVPAAYRRAPEGTPPGPAYNVAQAYVSIVQDLRDGGKRAPDFDHAVVRHRMIEAVREAARSGQRQVSL